MMHSGACTRWAVAAILLSVAMPGWAVGPAPAELSREAVLERLRGDYSLDGVARKRIEVEFDDLRGLAQPMTQRTTIQAKNHPDSIFVHPDLSIVLGAHADSYAIGFALGTPARLPAIALQPKMEVVQAEGQAPITVNNGLRFELQLKPGETRFLDFTVAGTSRLYPESERHPERRKPTRITVNGVNATIEDEVVTVNAPAGHVRIVAEYD